MRNYNPNKSSSLLDVSSGSKWIDEITLQIRHPRSEGVNYFLVEGHTDKLFFERYFQNSTRLFLQKNGNSKFEILKILRKLRESRKNIYAILDSDFDKLIKKVYMQKKSLLMLSNEASEIITYQYPSDLPIYTDCHDLEMTILSTGCFKNIAKLFLFEVDSTTYTDCFHSILRVTYEYGLIKYINLKYKLMLAFDNLNITSFLKVNNKDIAFNEMDAIKTLFNKSKSKKTTDQLEIYKLFLSAYTEYHSYNDICNGHDFIDVMSFYFKKIFNINEVNSKQLHKLLTVICKDEEFDNTELYKKIKNL